MMDLNFIVHALNLNYSFKNQRIGKITTDSRNVEAGDVFIALIGEKHDAHDFVQQVSEKGAWSIVSRPDCFHLPQCLVVEDTLFALQQLAHAWRVQMNPFVFGITGSSGKTTVKEMLACILRHAFGETSVLATAGNLNNHIGLPLTLLQLQEQHRYAVIEMGMNHFGELACLTQLAQPNIALVNNAMRAHIGCGFNGVEDIARAKSEIYQGVLPDGLALIPINDANCAIFQAASMHLKQQSFGLHQGDVYAQGIQLSPFGSKFQLCTPKGKIDVQLSVAGQHNIANACAAAALALSADVSLRDIAAALSGFSNIKGRLQIKAGLAGSTLIDDTYNANPDSMKAALDVLAALPSPRIFVMGDMGELGEQEAVDMHREVGRYAQEKGIEWAYFVGEHSVHAAEIFGEHGLWFVDKDPLIEVLIHQLPEKAHILVKGSRFMKMEDVIQRLSIHENKQS